MAHSAALTRNPASPRARAVQSNQTTHLRNRERNVTRSASAGKLDSVSHHATEEPPTHHPTTQEPTADDPAEPVPRAESLARIAAAAAALRARNITPPAVFVWSSQQKSRWWAFGRFGRYTVTRPRRFGWPVGDFPWEGAVRTGPDTIANEIFVKPTFVDVAGQIAPVDANRATPVDNHLLTDALCHEIAERMERIATERIAHNPGQHEQNPG
jgi:hypothetical protein